MASTPRRVCILLLGFLGTTFAQFLHETHIRSEVPRKGAGSLADDGQIDSYKDGGMLEEDDLGELDLDQSIKLDYNLHDFMTPSMEKTRKAIFSFGNRYSNRRREVHFDDNVSGNIVSDMKECTLDSHRRRMLDEDAWSFPNPTDWSVTECVHRRRIETVLKKPPLYPADFDNTFVLALFQEPNGRTYTIGKPDFNFRFQTSNYHIILRVCPSCLPYYQEIYYRRFTGLYNFQPYDYMTYSWSIDGRNTPLKDFKLYSSFADAWNDNNAWQGCGDKHAPGLGFPGDCSDATQFETNPDDQYNSFSIEGKPARPGGQNDYAFYILEENRAIQKRGKTKDVPQDMLAWFRSEDVSTSWTSHVSPLTISASSTFVTQPNLQNQQIYQSDGSSNPVNFLSGSDKASVSFGTIVSNDFTICAVTRYTGKNTDSKYGRILTGHDTNLLLGHYQGSVGVAFTDKWVTPQPLHPSPPSTRWLPMCTTAPRKAVKSDSEGFGSVSQTTLAQALGINSFADKGAVSINSNQPSHFGVMEVMAWDRILNTTELHLVHEYLLWKLEIGLYVNRDAVSDDTATALLETPHVLQLSSHWYKSDLINSGSTWGLTGVKPVLLRGHGLTAQRYAIQGMSSTATDVFGGNIKLPKESRFTICSVTRYTSPPFGHVLVGKDDSGDIVLVHGHEAGNVGVVKYGQQYKTAKTRNGNSLDWVVLCSSNFGQSVIDGLVDVSVPSNSYALPSNLSIVISPFSSPSNFAIMDLLIWQNQVLTSDEMRQVTWYLLTRMRDG